MGEIVAATSDLASLRVELEFYSGHLAYYHLEIGIGGVQAKEIFCIVVWHWPMKSYQLYVDYYSVVGGDVDLDVQLRMRLLMMRSHQGY